MYALTLLLALVAPPQRPDSLAAQVREMSETSRRVRGQAQNIARLVEDFRFREDGAAVTALAAPPPEQRFALKKTA